MAVSADSWEAATSRGDRVSARRCISGAVGGVGKGGSQRLRGPSGRLRSEELAQLGGTCRWLRMKGTSEAAPCCWRLDFRGGIAEENGPRQPPRRYIMDRIRLRSRHPGPKLCLVETGTIVVCRKCKRQGPGGGRASQGPGRASSGDERGAWWTGPVCVEMQAPWGSRGQAA